MTFQEFREHFLSFRVSADEHARSLKDSYVALEELCALYQAFDAEVRDMADQALSEWALSEDDGLRFDAQFLIDKFRIKSSSFALHQLITRLAENHTPHAAYELKKVHRLLSKLEPSGE